MAAKLLILLPLLFAGSLWGQATIEGKVDLAIPTRKAVTSPRYQSKVQPGAPAPRVAVIYLEGNFPDSAHSTNNVVVLAQKHLQFAESILPIQKGTLVQFPNHDEEYHNVLSYSRAKKFDLGRYLKDEKPPAVLFDKSGWVDLNCEIHEHMFANILVLDTPYFTRSDTNGVYKLENLPPGEYTLKAWLSPKVIHSKPVTLKSGDVLKVSFP